MSAFRDALYEAGEASLLPERRYLDGHEAAPRRGRHARSPEFDLNALRAAVRAKAPASAAYRVDEAPCSTVDPLGASDRAAAIVERRPRVVDR